MSKVDTAIEQIRTEANKLHQHLDEASAKNEAAIRQANEHAASKAQQLAAKLRTAAQEQRNDAAARFTNAAASLEAAAVSAKESIATKHADLREHNQETLHHVRAALQEISQGIADKAAVKQPV